LSTLLIYVLLISESFEKYPRFVIPAPAFARVNSGGNPEGLEKSGFLLSQE
jgi:hypothetical protein